MGSPPVNPIKRTGASFATSAWTSSGDIFLPPVKVNSLSHQVQRRLHPVRRTKIHGSPANVDSPCRERYISVICMGELSAPSHQRFSNKLLEVSGGGGVGLPNGDHLHADAARGRALEARIGLIEKVFRQVLGRWVQSLEGLDVVHHLMIKAVDDRLHHRLQIFEVEQQAGLVE